MLTEEASELIDTTADKLGLTRSEVLERAIRAGSLEFASDYQVAQVDMLTRTGQHDILEPQLTCYGFLIRGDMEKLTLVKLEISALHSEHTWYATTENGTVPEKFYVHLDEDSPLIRIIPVLNIEGIETWSEDDNFEEVEVDFLEDFVEKYIPRYKDCRWFTQRKIDLTPRQVRKRLLNN